MPATVTSNFRITNARCFIDSFEEPEHGGRNTVVGQSYVYLFIGKILSWDQTHAGYSDAVIPTPDGDVQGNEFEPWRDMIALDRVIANTDISFGARRYNWTSGTVYTPYDDQDPTIPKATARNGFYVFDADLEHVFKCLDNNKSAQSTIKPTRPTVEAVRHIPFVTSDGYRWKYMYSLSAAVSKKFLTINYIPVRTLNAIANPAGDTELVDAIPPGYEDQALIQKNANNGTIENYVVVDGGSGFTAHSGDITTRTIDATGGFVTNTSFFSLYNDEDVKETDDYYNGAAIFLSNTTHQKGIAIISDYGTLTVAGGGTQVRAVNLYPAFTQAYLPETGDNYHIGPRIEVIGDGTRNTDGSGGANAYSICTESGSISQINAWTTGNNYTTANVVTIGVVGGGTGLEARAIIPPPGGHGFDPVTELNGFNVIIAKTLTGSGTGNNFPITNEYRNVGLIKNPYLKDGYDASILGVPPATSGKNWYANTSPLHQSTWVVANTTVGLSGSWTPTSDDEVIGNTSGVTGRIIEYDTDGRAILNITNVVANTSGGSFMGNERIGRVKDKAGTSYIPATVYITANGWVAKTSGTFPGDIAHDSNSTIIYDPDLQPYTGDVLYLENRTPITRSTDQAEDIKIVIEF